MVWTVWCLTSKGQLFIVHIILYHYMIVYMYVDEPDVGTLPHTEVYSDDDQTFFWDDESGDSENENGSLIIVNVISVYISL